MTTDDPKSAGRLARRRFSGALMSDTKWRKLITTVAQHHDVINTIAVKFVDTEDVKTIRFPPSLGSPHAYMDTIEFGPVELRSIEWIDFPADISNALSRVGHFVLERRGDQTRVQGYVV